jgi:hypothetical protein
VNNYQLKNFWNILILFSFLIIAIVIGVIYSNFHEAKSFCDSVDGNYSFNKKTLNHMCDGEYIFKYNTLGWSFEIPDFRNFKINVSED